MDNPSVEAFAVNRLVEALDPVSIFERNRMEADTWQKELLRAKPKRAIVLSSRQAGKSTCSAALALHTALYSSGSEILVIAAAMRQAQELLRKVKALYQPFQSVAQISAETQQSIVFTNGSRIICLPADSATIRGYSSISLLIVDEAAFVPDQLFQTLKPMLAVSKGSLLLISTPNTVQGFFAQIWSNAGETYGVDAVHLIHDGWYRVAITADQNPRIDKATLEEDRQKFGEEAFLQEYMCAFVGQGEMVNNLKPFDQKTVNSIPLVPSSGVSQYW